MHKLSELHQGTHPLKPLLWSIPEGPSSVGWQRIALLKDRPQSRYLCAAEADKQQGQRVDVAEGTQSSASQHDVVGTLCTHPGRSHTVANA